MDNSVQLLLGQPTPVVEAYAPQLLYPINRSEGRSLLGLASGAPFVGVDVWHGYELSWLNGEGRPEARVGRFQISADTPNLIESKSFKLYLNSLNSKQFESDQEAVDCILKDTGEVAGGEVVLELFQVDSPKLAGAALAGLCLDDLQVSVRSSPPQKSILTSTGERVEETLYSHLLRSLCPVTGQPDWATVWFHYRGRALDRRSLLQYILAYRDHQEYHEQCVERMFTDIHREVEPELLTVQAFYTRRGGMDISPFRSTDDRASPQSRLNRQ